MKYPLFIYLAIHIFGFSTEVTGGLYASETLREVLELIKTTITSTLLMKKRFKKCHCESGKAIF